MTPFVLLLIPAFAVDILHDPSTEWCKNPHEQTLLVAQPTSPNKQAHARKQTKRESSTMKATHIKSFDGEYCLVFPDFRALMDLPAHSDDATVGVTVSVNGYMSYTEHYAMSTTVNPWARKERMDVGQYDWLLETQTPAMPFAFFTEHADLLVVSGLRPGDVVQVTLMRMHPDDRTFSCQTVTPRRYGCSVEYWYENLLERRFLHDGT